MLDDGVVEVVFVGLVPFLKIVVRVEDIKSERGRRTVVERSRKSASVEKLHVSGGVPHYNHSSGQRGGKRRSC